MTTALTDRQRAILTVLKEQGRPLAAGRISFLAFPDAEYRHRRDAGATRTLDSLERLGLVRGSYARFSSTGRDWTITRAGTEALG